MLISKHRGVFEKLQKVIWKRISRISAPVARPGRPALFPRAWDLPLGAGAWRGVDISGLASRYTVCPTQNRRPKKWYWLIYTDISSSRCHFLPRRPGNGSPTRDSGRRSPGHAGVVSRAWELTAWFLFRAKICYYITFRVKTDMSRMASEIQVYMLFPEKQHTTFSKTGKLKLLASFWYQTHLQTRIQLGERVVRKSKKNGN